MKNTSQTRKGRLIENLTKEIKLMNANARKSWEKIKILTNDLLGTMRRKLRSNSEIKMKILQRLTQIMRILQFFF